MLPHHDSLPARKKTNSISYSVPHTGSYESYLMVVPTSERTPVLCFAIVASLVVATSIPLPAIYFLVSQWRCASDEISSTLAMSPLQPSTALPFRPSQEKRGLNNMVGDNMVVASLWSLCTQREEVLTDKTSEVL